MKKLTEHVSILPFLKSLLIIIGLFGLAGPAFMPGINLIELYVGGTTDDYSEFCGSESGSPATALALSGFGAAKDCFLSLPHVVLLGLLSYIGAIVLLLPLAIFLLFILAARKRTRDASSK